jgi:hypothetical protein
MMYERRPHAGYFRGGSRQHKKRDELFAVQKLLESMEIAGESLYHSPRICEHDPPDCIAEDRRGRSVALEVTELVDEDAVAQAASGDTSLRLLEFDEVVERIRAILRKKDRAVCGVGSHSKIVLLICTDEYTLKTYRDCVEALKNRRFSPLKRIDEAYVLFSFDPYEEQCPYVQLRFGEDGESNNDEAQLT